MPYQFNPQEINRLYIARSECPSSVDKPTATGNWVPLYSALSSIFAERIAAKDVTGNDLQDMKDFKLWLDVAIGANGGTGMHSAVIRTFTDVQGELRIGRSFTDDEMQLASNGVALNVWRDISGLTKQENPNDYNIEPWTVPSIEQVAAADASSSGILSISFLCLLCIRYAASHCSSYLSVTPFFIAGKNSKYQGCNLRSNRYLTLLYMPFLNHDFSSCVVNTLENPFHEDN